MLVPRCGAVCPGTFTPVLKIEGKCSRLRAKPAHFVGHLPILHKSARPREAVWLHKGAPEILRCAQDDSLGLCHPERSEGSLRPLSQTLRSAQGDTHYLQMSIKYCLV